MYFVRKCWRCSGV